MIVEVSGGEFVNRGAQLMLLTVAEMLRRSEPQSSVGVDVSLCRGYPGSGCGIAPLFPRLVPFRRPYWMFSRFCGLDRAAGGLVPRALCEGKGFVRRSAVSALLDVSGYAFGDPHPWQRARLFANVARDYRRRGYPVAMLPQMLGPFRTVRAADEFKRVLESVDLVYARDRESLEMALAIAPGDPRIRLAPDITIFTGDLWPDSAAREAPVVCIVPNTRMLDRRGSPWVDTYLPLLGAAGRRVSEKGLQTCVLLHDGSDEEREFGERLRGLCGSGCSIVDDPDPISLKRIISGAHFLVGSRYHAIVAALSSGVPAITLGWAHKYDRLLEDFGEARFLVRPRDGEERLLELVDTLACDRERQEISQRLIQRREAMRPASRAMWQEVRALLGLREAVGGHVG